MDSHLSLNRYFANVEFWTEQAIRQRGRLLAEKVAHIWPRPPGPYTPHRADPESPELLLDEDETANGQESLPVVRGQRTRIVITIHWSAVNVPKESETLGRTERAADTMAKFLGRLVDELGLDILTKAEVFRFGNNRRLVSTDPTKDFAYGSVRRVYQNKEIPSTRHRIMTGIDNDEKKRVLTQLLRHLGLPQEMCVFEVVSQNDIFDEFDV